MNSFCPGKSDAISFYDMTMRDLLQVTDKTTGRSLPLEIFFAAYPTAQFRSGAYLFKPDGHQVPSVNHSIDFGLF